MSMWLNLEEVQPACQRKPMGPYLSPGQRLGGNGRNSRGIILQENSAFSGEIRGTGWTL